MDVAAAVDISTAAAAAAAASVAAVCRESLIEISNRPITIEHAMRTLYVGDHHDDRRLGTRIQAHVCVFVYSAMIFPADRTACSPPPSL